MSIVIVSWDRNVKSRSILLKQIKDLFFRIISKSNWFTLTCLCILRSKYFITEIIFKSIAWAQQQHETFEWKIYREIKKALWQRKIECLRLNPQKSEANSDSSIEDQWMRGDRGGMRRVSDYNFRDQFKSNWHSVRLEREK